jgi:hypothetical protein
MTSDKPAKGPHCQARGRGVALLEALHAVGLAVVLGAAVMSGVVAAIVFPAMRELRPTLGLFEGFGGDHANLAAGWIAARVFAAADIGQFAGTVLALATVLGLVTIGRVPRTKGTGARVVLVCVVVTLVSYKLFVLGPRMDANLRAYWAAAQQGQTDRAESFRAAFAADHPGASRTIGATAIAALAALGVGVGSAARRGRA